MTSGIEQLLGRSSSSTIPLRSLTCLVLSSSDATSTVLMHVTVLSPLFFCFLAGRILCKQHRVRQTLHAMTMARMRVRSNHTQWCNNWREDFLPLLSSSLFLAFLFSIATSRCVHSPVCFFADGGTSISLSSSGSFPDRWSETKWTDCMTGSDDKRRRRKERQLHILIIHWIV